MSTALQIKPKPLRATINLCSFDGTDGRIGETTLTIGNDVIVSEDLFGDEEMIVLVEHMFCEGETFEGHVIREGDRHSSSRSTDSPTCRPASTWTRIPMEIR